MITAPVEAEIVCEGSDCNKIQQSYGAYSNDFQHKYVPLLTQDILMGHSLAAATGIPGVVNLTSFTVGAFATAGFTKVQRVQVQNDQTGAKKTLSEQGFSLQPNLFVGVNLGWFLSTWYSLYTQWFRCSKEDNCAPEYEFPLLSRIDVYVYGVGHYRGGDIENSSSGTKSHSSANATGAALRIHAVDEIRILGGILRFSGISVGGGGYRSRQRMILRLNENLALDGGQLFQYEWSATDTLESDVTTKTAYAYIRTGFNILHLVWVYAGAGVSETHGTSAVSYRRDAVMLTPSQYTDYNANFGGNYENTVRMTHVLAGLNLGPIVVQGAQSLQRNPVTNKRVFAVSIGVLQMF